MERALETHGTIGVVRCRHVADGQYFVLPGYGRAFQPAIGDASSDHRRARCVALRYVDVRRKGLFAAVDLVSSMDGRSDAVIAVAALLALGVYALLGRG